ncbi:MAG: ABC transporter permease [Synergistetes bacterium]|nr:ABC transporter permease [Synergistota bacterium]MCX8127402.1 ABC transporter permease [Synergistota bacterium]
MLLFRIFKWVLRGKWEFSSLKEQMSRVGVDSLPLIVITFAFAGMVIAVQMVDQFIRFGAESLIGGIIGLSISRELAPVMTALIVTGRVGASFAAEIGTMKVTEQIDALEVMGVDPVNYLVVPRFLACTFMLPVLTIFSDFVGIIGGYFVVMTREVNVMVYKTSLSELMDPIDVIGGLIKSSVFGGTIALVSCYAGMNASGGARGVGVMTTAAVVVSNMLILVLNYFLSVLIFSLRVI